MTRCSMADTREWTVVTPAQHLASKENAVRSHTLKEGSRGTPLRRTRAAAAAILASARLYNVKSHLKRVRAIVTKFVPERGVAETR